MYFGGTGVEVIIIKRVIRDELFGDVENLGAFPVRAQTKLVLAYLADGFDRQVLFSFIKDRNELFCRLVIFQQSFAYGCQVDVSVVVFIEVHNGHSLLLFQKVLAFIVRREAVDTILTLLMLAALVFYGMFLLKAQKRYLIGLDDNNKKIH